MPLPLETDRPPGFASAATILRGAIQSIRPPQKVSVSEAAEQHRHLHNPGAYIGKWRNEQAPYLVEPMDACRSRDYRTVGVFGPPQVFGKTEIALNVIGHAALYAPADILIFQPTRDMALDFATRRIQTRMLDCSPDLRAEVGHSRSDDKVMEKRFRNGTLCTVAWPTGGQLASRPVQIVILDERDSMDDDIEGTEGDPVELARNRTLTFHANGKVIVLSSFKRTDESGSILIFREGDQCLWHWPCPDCGEYFAPGFDADRQPTMRFDKDGRIHTGHFVFDGLDSGDEAAARRSVRIACPHCGSLIDDRRRFAMNLAGTWLGVGETIDAAGNIGGERRGTGTASYWFAGIASNQADWGNYAADIVKAVTAFNRTRNESDLKAIFNRMGYPFRSATADLTVLSADALRQRAEPYPLRLVPPAALLLTAAVDVQINRFDVLVRAWGKRGESWVIDRFQLFKATEADGTLRAVDPATRAEDWRQIEAEVLRRQYPDASGTLFPIVCTAIDTGGRAGVTQKAYDFWTAMRQNNLGRAVMLIKGSSKPTAPPLLSSMIEVDRNGKKLKHGIKLWALGTNALKDRLHAELTRPVPGPGFLHLSTELPDMAFEQIAAERKVGAVWERQAGQANETLDLLVYTTAAFIRIGGDRIHWESMSPVTAAAAVPTALSNRPAAVPARPERTTPPPQQAPARQVVRSPFMRR